MAANKVTAVRLGLGKIDSPGLLSRRAQLVAFSLASRSSQEAVALARSRASRRRSRRRLARSAGRRSCGTGSV